MPKLQPYELQDSGLDTVEASECLSFKADHREFAKKSFGCLFTLRSTDHNENRAGTCVWIPALSSRRIS